MFTVAVVSVVPVIAISTPNNAFTKKLFPAFTFPATANTHGAFNSSCKLLRANEYLLRHVVCSIYAAVASSKLYI